MSQAKVPEQQAAADLAKRRERSIGLIAKAVAARKATWGQFSATRRTNANPYGSRYR